MSVIVISDLSRGMLRQGQANVRAWLLLMRRRRRGDIRLRPWISSAGLAVSGTVIAAVIAVVMVTCDTQAIIAARALPDGVHRAFGIITDFGKSGWFLWPIGGMMFALALATSPRLGRFGTGIAAALAVRLSFVFAAIALPGVFTAVTKDMIGRARPFVGGSPNPFLYHPFAWKPAYASLPSGHTTTAVAAAVAIGAVWPASRPYVWVYAVLIMVSRLIVTAHHPSDIIAGAVVGTVGAVLVRNWFAARRLAFAVGPDGTVEAKPGPSWRRVEAIARNLRGRGAIPRRQISDEP